MIRRSIFLFIAIFLLIAVTGCSGQPQDKVEVGVENEVEVGLEGELVVLDSTPEVDFPKSLTFNLEVRGPVEITKIVLRYRVEKIGHASVISEARPEFTAAPQVETSWTWDMRKSRLPPGAEVDYQWIVEDAAERRVETDLAAVRFEDLRYSWRSLTADKVTLLWYVGEQSFAQELMDAALQALDKLAEDTGAQLEKPARIYIYASSADLRQALIYPQEWTGGVAFTEYGVVAIGIAPNPKSLAWGKRTVAHELAHLVIHQVTFTYYGDLPTWLDEGLAVYAEGPLSPEFSHSLNQAIPEGRLISVRSLSSSFSAHPEEALLSYAQSYSLVEFLIKSYGRDKMLDLLDVFRQGSGYDEALMKVYGFDMDGLDALWRASIGAEPRSLSIGNPLWQSFLTGISLVGEGVRG